VLAAPASNPHTDIWTFRTQPRKPINPRSPGTRPQLNPKIDEYVSKYRGPTRSRVPLPYIYKKRIKVLRRVNFPRRQQEKLRLPPSPTRKYEPKPTNYIEMLIIQLLRRAVPSRDVRKGQLNCERIFTWRFVCRWLMTLIRACRTPKPPKNPINGVPASRVTYAHNLALRLSGAYKFVWMVSKSLN